MAADLFFDDWGVGSNLDASSRLLKSGGGLFDGITGAQMLTAGSSVLSSALAPSPAGPSNATSGQGYQSIAFDNSGWTVATGKASAEGGDRGIDLTQWAILGLGLLAVIAWKNKKKS